ncbi:type II CRISPR-associated endonuclease Cas1 [Ligilactobacillus salivarius]|uniref:type II CRISPR-associated endonuclease Cas1 n=1 Tax=Ligilactobacillus salivarius TaxID=1624 RepID=UPI0022E688C9|nr:type II CRISPR-associated endonuclease Cas1 [Ligilactobacillus salivarius]
MGFRNVIITQHSKLSYSNNAMIVQNKDGINQIPLVDMDILLISTTQAVITSALVGKLAESGIKEIFTDNKNEPVTETVNYYPNNRSLGTYLQQYEWNDHVKEILWTKIVRSKIINQIKVLKNYQIDCQDLKNELDKLEINDMTNREAVVARKYFEKLFGNKYSRKDFTPMNAALNYGYSILLSAVNKEIVSAGYVTYLGIHHQSQENMFNFGSDLMEPFRPVVDYWLADKNFLDFTPDIKYGLVDLLNLEIKYNKKQMLLKNAIAKYVRDVIEYLNQETVEFDMEVEFTNEVPNNAINDNV